jgi:hypothetical protein
MTTIGRQHLNIKNRISQQLLVRYFSNFKFKLRGPKQNIQWKMTWNHKEYNVTEGEIREKLRGNLECGPAQPSLLDLKLGHFLYVQSVLISTHLLI